MHDVVRRRVYDILHDIPKVCTALRRAKRKETKTTATAEQYTCKRVRPTERPSTSATRSRPTQMQTTQSIAHASAPAAASTAEGPAVRESAPLVPSDVLSPAVVLVLVVVVEWPVLDVDTPL